LFTPRYTGPERRKTPRRRQRPLRVLLSLLTVAALAYVGAGMWFIRQETRLVFQAGSTLATGRPPFPYVQIEIPRPDGASQFAWVIRPGDTDAGPWVLYLHGNISSVASQVNISHYRVLRGLGMNVLAPEYRGFGGIPGVPTEGTLQADARAAYDYLRETRRIAPHAIVVYGWSLGSAVAVDMASRQPPAAMILEGAPSSLVDLTRHNYPFFPMRWLMRSSFDSIRTINEIPTPILFLHAARDEVIPIEQGRRLHEAARGAKMFVETRGSHVTAVDVDSETFERAISEFMARHNLKFVR
jgi:fermentation-respiration switch protein FrsA (DUF1100 family)